VSDDGPAPVELPPPGAVPPAAAAALTLPERLPVVPLLDTVTFPDTYTPLAVGQERTVRLVNDVLGGNRMLAMVASANPQSMSPGPDDLYRVGVAGVVARMVKLPDGTLRILVQGGPRVRIDEWVQTEPYLVARVSELPDVVRETPELVALTRNVQATFSQIVEQVPYLPEELQVAIANLDDPSALTHLIAGSLRLKTDEKQALLEEVDVAKRLRRLSEILARELELISIGSRIQSQVQSELDKTQREYFLRQQLRAIQQELGETDEMEAEANELRSQLDELMLPDEVRAQVDRELARLARLPPAAAEHGVIRGWLEWIASLPWATYTEDNLDLRHARRVLDEDHYDIEQVKDRIIEFLAVRSLRAQRGGAADAGGAGAGAGAGAGSILCLVGPPGVGKTSLGRSIARALERRFERISVGGVRDEAEIRGHRRTYIGALPGVIIRALRDAGSANPLFMIDEIDKMGSDFRGDPSSAMLEVLDPEQNRDFRDHYLDVPFDLSAVLFVTTANFLDAIPGPLRDRMEVITLAGYTEAEKLEIARRYLVPRQIERNGLSRGQIAFSDAALKVIIAEYTREAGVRGLERQIGAIARKIARQVAEANGAPGGRGRRRAGAGRDVSARDDLGRPGPRAARSGSRSGHDRCAAAHPRAGRRHRARLDPGRRRRALHRGDGLSRRRAPHAHRAARGGHARVGPGRALVRTRPCGHRRAGPPRRLVRTPRPAPARAGRGDPQGRPERGDHDGHRVDLAALGATRPRRRGDDRRGDVDGAGPAHRRPEGEGPRRPAQRHQARHRPGGQSHRPGRVPRGAREGRAVRVGGGDGAGARRGAGGAAGGAGGAVGGGRLTAGRAPSRI